MNDSEYELNLERQRAARRQQSEVLRRERQGRADALELGALEMRAAALHLRAGVDGFRSVARILWNGWVEEWQEFRDAHRESGREPPQCFPASSRQRLREHRRILGAFEEMYAAGRVELNAAGVGGRRRLLWTARFLARHGGWLHLLRVSQRQRVAPYPFAVDGRRGDAVPPGTTRH